jgi:protein SCO1
MSRGTNAPSSVWMRRACAVAWGGCLALAQVAATQNQAPPETAETHVQTFIGHGVIQELHASEKTITIAHEAIGSYMPAMTMPFKVRTAEDLKDLRRGDVVQFQLHVTDTESWIQDLQKTTAPSAANPASEGTQPTPMTALQTSPVSPPPPLTSPALVGSPKPRHPLMDFPFTNELGERVTLGDFHGQALAITFFYTRCPIPEFCPRLSRNFQQAALKLSSLSSAPTNWHFLSVSFDTEFDTPAMLKAYAQGYHYDPKHWSFLTGPSEQIQELARLSDVTFSRDNGLINHNFRTLVIDAAGHLQTVFPIGGDLSDALATEILKAAAITNRSS